MLYIYIYIYTHTHTHTHTHIYIYAQNDEGGGKGGEEEKESFFFGALYLSTELQVLTLSYLVYTCFIYILYLFGISAPISYSGNNIQKEQVSYIHNL